jgi:hypothetical protein
MAANTAEGSRGVGAAAKQAATISMPTGTEVDVNVMTRLEKTRDDTNLAPHPYTVQALLSYNRRASRVKRSHKASPLLVARRLPIPLYCSLCVELPAILAHRVAAHLDAMGVVHEPVEDAIGLCGIAYLFVPTERPAVEGLASSNAP